MVFQTNAQPPSSNTTGTFIQSLPSTFAFSEVLEIVKSKNLTETRQGLKVSSD
jgi:hypothetical protein